jgi:hypothetical protein
LTVFAPTDAAFAALQPSVRDSLLAPANRGLLARVLAHHVAHRALSAADVARSSGVETLRGHHLPITTRAGDLYVAGARIVTADLPCANGVVHLIDRVMLRTQHASATSPTPPATAGGGLTDHWERPPHSALRVDAPTGLTLADAQAIQRVVNRLLALLRETPSVTQLSVLLALYIVLR